LAVLFYLTLQFNDVTAAVVAAVDAAAAVSVDKTAVKYNDSIEVISLLSQARLSVGSFSRRCCLAVPRANAVAVVELWTFNGKRTAVLNLVFTINVTITESLSHCQIHFPFLSLE